MTASELKEQVIRELAFDGIEAVEVDVRGDEQTGFIATFTQTIGPHFTPEAAVEEMLERARSVVRSVP